MRKFLSILFLCFALTCFAQQPSYFVIGKEEFSGVDIYSIIQDKEANIWVASEKGLFKYDGYTFTPYTNAAMKTKELFSLRLDNLGTVFCSNLYGQIFNIQNDSLHLFYEISNERLSNVIEFEFDNLNRLVYCTNGYFLIDENKKTKEIFPYKGFSKTIAKTADDELILVDLDLHKLVYYKDKKLQKTAIPLPKNLSYTNIRTLAPYSTENSLMLKLQRTATAYEWTGSDWNEVTLNNPQVKKINCRRYSEQNGNFWLADESKGLYAFDNNGKQLYGDNILFPNFSVSGMLQDREGSLWFATLGKGLIIIPNKNFIDFTNHPLLINDDIKTITSGSNSDVFFAGLKRNVYKLSSNKVEQFYKTDLVTNYIKYLPNHSTLYVPQKTIELPNKKVKALDMNSVKDICRFSKNAYICATNQGADILYTGPITVEDNKKLSGFVDHAKELGRVWCIEYDSINDNIWFQSTAGTRIYKNGKSHPVLNKKNSLLARDIEFFNGSIWVATENGLYQYQNKELISLFNTSKGLLSEDVSQIKARNKKLYISTALGFQEYNPTASSFKNIKKQDGLLSNQILDFEVVKKDIWLVFAAGIQKVQFDKIEESKITPILNFKSITAGGLSILNQANKQLSHNENEVVIEFVGKYYKNKEALHYEYQLLGQDTAWNRINYSENRLKFLSLSPGNYTFNVRAVAKSVKSQPLSYSFAIKNPFWKTWWFILLSVILLSLVGAIIVLYRIKNVKQRLDLEQQLKLSEITALKAQMNPHFVFNCLNSIQALVLQKDVNVAYDYISKFAKLVRSVMHQSGKDLIAFDEEIETLKIYLDLEKLRFKKDDFEYTMDSTVASEIQIPPMLIQPFVENALKHGLLHKADKKNLKIKFELVDELLHCEITDNGIGREKSTEIKKRQKKSHQSFATQTTDSRFKLLQKQYGKSNLGVVYKDLQNDNNEPIGTTVFITIPCKIVH